MTTTTTSRRLFLAGGPAAAVFAALHTATALPDSTSTLASLIEAHKAAHAAFYAAIDAQDATEPDRDQCIAGIGETSFSLKNGRGAIVDWIENHHHRLTHLSEVLSAVAPDLGSAALAVLDAERDAALGRLAEIYADHDAAQARWAVAEQAEEDALVAICAYRCGGPDELAVKFAYLDQFRGEFDDEHMDALFASFQSNGPGNQSEQGRGKLSFERA